MTLKPIKITAELLITPEMFEEWRKKRPGAGDSMYKSYVESLLYKNFVAVKSDGFTLYDVGNYDDFIGTIIEDNGNGVKLTIEEIQ